MIVLTEQKHIFGGYKEIEIKDGSCYVFDDSKAFMFSADLNKIYVCKGEKDLAINFSYFGGDVGFNYIADDVM